MSVTSKEITERKKMERKLKKAKDRYEDLFEGANELVVTTDPEGLVKRVNRKVLDSSGYSKDEIVGESVLKLAHPEDEGKFIEFWKDVLEGKEETKVLRGISKDGEVFWLRAGGRPIRENGEIVELQYRLRILLI